MNAQEVATFFHGCSTGVGRWKARCPAHNDRSPSLNIGVGREGRVLLYCFAGCDLDDILTAARLTRRDISTLPRSSGKQAIAENRERNLRMTLVKERRSAERTDVEFMRKLERKLDDTMRELGSRLSLMPDGDANEIALTARFHDAANAHRTVDRNIRGDVDDWF